MNIVVGKRYRNMHSGRVCIVMDKIFFNIKYKYDNDGGLLAGRPLYTHYKKFQKNWEPE